jgi:type II secretory pathway pseudopilin PulG
VAAFSLIDLLFVLGLAATLGAVAVPQLAGSVDDMQTRAAARYVATRLQQTRMSAVMRRRDTAMRFTTMGSTYSFTVYADGNRNGVRTGDIERGIDRPVQATERLPDQFRGVDFGAAPGLPPVDAGGTPPGTDPIRLGAGSLATFTSTGTATAGSLYIRGRGNAQYVIRIFGDTGKTRVLTFNARSGTWMPL